MRMTGGSEIFVTDKMEGRCGMRVPRFSNSRCVVMRFTYLAPKLLTLDMFFSIFPDCQGSLISYMLFRVQ